jgi:hypothetical protein
VPCLPWEENVLQFGLPYFALLASPSNLHCPFLQKEGGSTQEFILFLPFFN